MHRTKRRQTLIILQDNQCRHAHILAVEVWRLALQKLHALPIVRQNVLRTASGARGLGKAHRNTGHEKRLKNCAGRLLIVQRHLVGHRRDAVSRVARQLRHALTVAFARQQMRHLPVDQRNVLRHHVAKASRFKLRR